MICEISDLIKELMEHGYLNVYVYIYIYICVCVCSYDVYIYIHTHMLLVWNIYKHEPQGW